MGIHLITLLDILVKYCMISNVLEDLAIELAILGAQHFKNVYFQ